MQELSPEYYININYILFELENILESYQVNEHKYACTLNNDIECK